MKPSALVWSFLGTSSICLSLIAASALADPGALSTEGEEMIWWARLIWVLGVVVVFGLLLLLIYWMRFHWLPRWKKRQR
jgi:hypothetical protein